MPFQSSRWSSMRSSTRSADGAPSPSIAEASAPLNESESTPSLSTETVLSVAYVLSQHVLQGDESRRERPSHAPPSVLDERHFSLGEPFLVDLAEEALDSFSNELRGQGATRQLLVQAELSALLVCICTKLRFSDGIIVMALLLIERMLRLSFELTLSNVRPTLVTALNIAAKVFSDEHLSSTGMSYAIPELHIAYLAEMELEMLSVLDWDITPYDWSTYAAYTAELQSLYKSKSHFIAHLRMWFGRDLNTVAARNGIRSEHLDFEDYDFVRGCM